MLSRLKKREGPPGLCRSVRPALPIHRNHIRDNGAHRCVRARAV